MQYTYQGGGGGGRDLAASGEGALALAGLCRVRTSHVGRRQVRQCERDRSDFSLDMTMQSMLP